MSSSVLRFGGGGRHRYSDYGKGSVIRVELHNFMTYKDAVLEPGPRLNLVLGPNGTGKSSFVCALCLGLAGGTTLLARADNVKDFIRRGEDEGSVTITLASGKAQPLVVYRRIRTDAQSGGISDWKLNGATCAMKDVKQKMKDLNVQLDNLCQFLPQDKVVEFAKLSPVELLRETQKAIGDSRLADLHKELIEENKLSNTSNRERNSVATELHQQQDLNGRLQRDVERFKNREQLLAKVKLIESKLPWIEYNDAMKEFTEVKDRRRQAEACLEARKKDFEESQQPLRGKAEELHVAKEATKALFQKLKRLDAQQADLIPTANNLTDRLDEAQKELGGLDRKVQEQAAKVKRAEEEVAKTTADLQSLPPPPEGVNEKKADLQKRLRDLDMQTRSADTSSRELEDDQKQHKIRLDRIKGQLNEMDNIKGQRLLTLMRILRSDGIKKAYEWVVNGNRSGLFRGVVYGPILLEVQVQDKQHGIYLEENCPLSLWQRFVTTFREDQDLLVKEFADKTKGYNFRPIVSNYQGNPQAVITHPKGEAQQYARYGITHTLDQVFEAPPVVKHVMTDEANLNEAYVGTRETHPEDCLSNNPQLANLWTPESHYSVRTSMYNKDARSQSVSQVNGNRNLISGSASSQERDTLQQQYQEVLQVCNGIHQQIEQQRATMHSNTASMTAMRSEVSAMDHEVKSLASRRLSLTTRLTVKRKVLDRLKDAPDPRAKAPELHQKIQDTSQGIAKLMQDGKRSLQQSLAGMKVHAVAELHSREVALQEAVQRLNALVESHRQRVKQLLAAAKAVTGGNPDAQLQEEFLALTEDVDQLKQDAIRLRAEAEGIACTNPRVLQQFQERQKKIADMEAKLKDKDEEVATRQERIKELHDQWYPDLKRTVKKIDQTFQRNFRDIGCAGEVSLAEHADYDKFAVEIKVKFRDEEDLQVLTANRQSGGERSVSTILYLISIQDVTVCPFRVVDEINQGMDPINERKVFMQLVESACRPGTPQCFLLTPKLLPALPFTPAVQILQIWNGSTIKKVSGCFDQVKVLGSRKRIRGYAG
ncbi:MAG: structural maintenance of chromosomes 5 [Trebouxia sp. A1-2]|nr:MAG: structural maintenance of chromosomes 5 [Trebouxia sp. A1-2]